MTTAVKYWRVYYRSVNTLSYGQLVFRTLQPRDAAGNPLTTGLVIAASGFLMNATSYPVTNLIDDDTASASYCAINYPDYQSTTQWRYFSFTYAADTLPDHFLLNISETALNANSVVPVRPGASLSATPSSFRAFFMSVFFTTRYSTPTFLNSLRSSAILATLNP